jgi:hypothetical protein
VKPIAITIVVASTISTTQAAKVAMTTPQISGLTSVLLHILTFSVVTTLTHVGEESRPAALQR